MTHNPVGWFEIPVSDLDRAKHFYENLLNIALDPHSMDGFDMLWFPSVPNAVGAMGALCKGMDYTPASTGTVVYFTCPDIEGALAKVEALGGKVLFPKKDIGEYGYIAWLADSEGNTIALHTRKDA